MEKHCNPPPRGQVLMQEVQPLAFQFRVEEDETCDVSARTVVTLRPSCCDQVPASIGHHDGNGAGGCPSGSDRSRSNGNDKSGLRRDEFDSQIRRALLGIISGEDLTAELRPSTNRALPVPGGSTDGRCVRRTDWGSAGRPARSSQASARGEE
jgi:hypothetical protein